MERNVVRIILRQNQANYRREESITNKMTYPLPPFSTVIGALHKACGFASYRPMDISIQGEYQSLQREAYTDYSFLNSVMDDRGILVRLTNPQMLSGAYEVVAKAKKPQGNSFKDGKTIEVVNEDLLAEYRYLKELVNQLEQEKKMVLEPAVAQLVQARKTLEAQQKQMDKKSPAFAQAKETIGALKQKKVVLEEEFAKKKQDLYDKPYSHFASLVTSLRYYEVLYGVTLVLHIHSDEATMSAIMDNIPELTAIGRSEDFVDVLEAKWVRITDDIKGQYYGRYPAYLDVDKVRSEAIMVRERLDGIKVAGTVYYLNKNYVIENKQRIFEKKKVLYSSGYQIDEESDGIYIDEDGYVVDLL